jgi:hypothetical protein
MSDLSFPLKLKEARGRRPFLLQMNFKGKICIDLGLGGGKIHKKSVINI